MWFAVCVLALISVSGTAAQKNYTDECSQYPTCAECLKDHSYCGWCHSNIVYSSGGQGGHCADIRDKPWKCPSVYDTAGCSSGYMCNYTTGQCTQAPSGQGIYPNTQECQAHCFETPKTYKCDTSSYQCVLCQEGDTDPNCGDRETSCLNCKAPDAEFRCDNTTDPKNPKCVRCPPQSSDNCTDFKSACTNCQVNPHPPPPGPTPPPTPPPPSNYFCNETAFQCQQNSSGHGLPEKSCSMQCSNSTPPEFVGTWRGFEAQHGFQQGEFDLNLTADGAVLFKLPNGDVMHGHASNVEGLVLTFSDGEYKGTTLYGNIRGLSSAGPETKSVAIMFGAPGKPAPPDLPTAMNATDGQKVYIMTACLPWKSGGCDFSSVFASKIRRSLRGRLNRLSRPRIVLPPHHERYQQQSPSLGNDTDPCNALLNCSSCVAARLGDVQCGWCFGAKLVYKDTGPSEFRCGGFVQGKAKDFTCESNFRTEDCSGYSCSWNETQPKCYASEAGEFGTESDCEKTCKPHQMARCNEANKQCETCTEGTPNCTQTVDQCQAVCGQPRSKCNTTTGQCESCDPVSDPDCTKLPGDCETSCHVTSYGICDATTGQCVECDPNKHQTGCTQSCNSTCKPGGGYGCDNTTHMCIQDQGNMTLTDCANECLPSNRTKGKYGCDWSHEQPICKEGAGDLSQEDCERNCKQPSFARCNYTSGTCETCKRGDPGCTQTEAFCNATCKKIDASGVYRGIQINKDFPRGEWDMTFFADDTVAFELQGSSDRYEAKVDGSGSGTTGQPISFTMTTAPSGGPLDVQVGDVLSGLFIQLTDESRLTDVLYLALGTPNSAATSFDDAMTKFEFVLFKCKSESCDFSSAALPE